MQECNPPRNSRSQTHQTMSPGRSRKASSLEPENGASDDRSAHALKTHNVSFRLPRLFGATAGGGAGSALAADLQAAAVGRRDDDLSTDSFRREC